MMRQGDILVASWGYDQTNATFFRVERATEKTAWIVELQPRVGEDRRLYPSDEVRVRHEDEWKCVPHGHVEGCWEPQRYRRKIQSGGAYLRVHDYMYAYPYEGGGAYDTIAAGYPGH